MPLLPNVLLLICSVALLHSTTLADTRPEGGDPVFQIFASGRGGGSQTRLYMKGDQPLMVISTAANVEVSKDRKAVRLTMTAADARKFADITRRHTNELLILMGRGRALQGVMVTSPVTNGVLEFLYPGDAAAADYLKKRFRLK
jgi:hypothetical protein